MGRRKDYPFHKSDVDFGTNLLASLIVAPFALLLSSTPSTGNCNWDYTERKEPTLSDKEHKYGIDAQLLGSLSSDKYKHLKDIYHSQVITSSEITDKLFVKQKKLSWLYNIVKFFGFIPYIKRTVENKIRSLNNSIDLLREKSFEPSIATNKVSDWSHKFCNIQLSGYSFVFGEFKYYVRYNQRLFGEMKANPFFKMSAVPIVSLNCEYLQLHLMDSYLIIMTQKDFSIIDYNNISCSYSSETISEVGLKSTEGLKVILKTWEHTCRDGSPDLRYKYNDRLYLVEYGKLMINICDAFSVSILFNDYNFGNTIYCMLTNNLSVSQN